MTNEDKGGQRRTNLRPDRRGGIAELSMIFNRLAYFKGNRGKRPGTEVQHCICIVIPAGAKRRAGIQNAAAFLDCRFASPSVPRVRGNDDWNERQGVDTADRPAFWCRTPGGDCRSFGQSQEVIIPAFAE